MVPEHMPQLVRINGLLAREAPMAVILRRGPKRQTQQLVWKLETDEIVTGQWIKGIVHFESFDLSPNGRYLIGCYQRPRSEFIRRRYKHLHWGKERWTAVSRPPYFTALAVWFGWDAGGGYWVSNNELEVDPREGRNVSRPVPAGFTLRPTSEEHSRPEARMGLQGWTCVQQTSIEAGIWEKPFEHGVLRRVLGPSEISNSAYEQHCSALDKAGNTVRSWESHAKQAQFLDVDHRGRVTYGENGCLRAWDGFPDGEPKLIADLNANQFEPIEAPDWAKEW